MTDAEKKAQEIVDDCCPSTPNVDALRITIRKALTEARRQGMMEGYYLGFMDSGEGYNGEYPYRDNGEDPAGDSEWTESRDMAIARAIEDAAKG